MNSLSRVAALAVSTGTGSFHSLLLFTELLHSNSDQGKCFPSSLWNPLWRPSPYYAQHFRRVHKGSWVRQCCESKFQFFHQLTGVLWLQGGAPFFLCLSRIKKNNHGGSTEKHRSTFNRCVNFMVFNTLKSSAGFPATMGCGASVR